MKKFVAIYLGSAEGLAEWKATNDEKRKEREQSGRRPQCRAPLNAAQGECTSPLSTPNCTR